MEIKKPETFAEWLDLFCLKYNVSVAEIAANIGLSRTMLYLIKQNKRSLPAFFVDTIIEKYKLTENDAKELVEIVTKNRMGFCDFISGHNTHALTKVELSRPWTKRFMSLSAKVVNVLDANEIEHLMKQMVSLYKKKTNTDLCIESMKELEKRFYDIKSHK